MSYFNPHLFIIIIFIKTKKTINMRLLNKTLLLGTILFSIGCSNKEVEVETKDVEFKIDYEKFTLDNGLEVILTRRP